VLFAQHHRTVMTYAMSLTRDRFLADEVVQETFIRAWRYLDTFDQRGSFEGWLIRISRNCMVDLVRRSQRDHELTSDPRQGPRCGADAVDQSGYGTAELWDLIDRLPSAYREVLVLISVLGYRSEFVAELMSISEVTVRTRLLRARNALRAELLAASNGSEEFDGLRRTARRGESA
jgi:RNA polymerase sigma-70 factor, ECF subfamily